MKKASYCIAFSLLIIAGTILASCKKSTVSPKKADAASGLGYWYGTFVNNNGAGSHEGILFRGDGTLKVYDFYKITSQTDTTQTILNATGTYSVSGNIITFSYAFPAESFTATGTINKNTNPATLSYTFTDPNSILLSGTATVSKQSN